MKRAADALPVPAALGPTDRELLEGVLAAQSRALAKAITLVESTRADHQRRAHALLQALLPHAGGAIRIGVSGAPGVGKSTFVEALGLHAIEAGHRIAVLAVDPSSALSGGSILGDKTRMEQLARSPQAYIRPSPSAGTLGGVAGKTRETLLVCEAAGFDVIVVETVGVGQSETAVAGMTDALVLLQLPNAGDDLQAMKKGIVELADLIVINKCDLDPQAAQRARSQFESVLPALQRRSTRWIPSVLVASALTHQGIAEFWIEVGRFGEAMRAGGELEARRRAQAVSWMWEIIEHALRDRFGSSPEVQRELPALTAAVQDGSVAATVAAQHLLALAGIE
ncbi:MAG TPA: methylmalonyl Co-A mutase-associated GTPase MeaB [Burkholderiaceae bacterium]|nr:methylmalonyl Co-A mutase-associated GTPase MeaB [Burkholderiaceae bacterium]